MSYVRVKNKIKRLRDRLYSKRLPGKRSFGTEDVWTILTNHLENPIVYSGGVGKNITFESMLIEEISANVYLFDPTPTAKRTMSKVKDCTQLKFYPIALSNRDGLMELYDPINTEEASFTSVPYKRAVQRKSEFPCRKISSLMNEFGHSKIDILKIDIEGAEYDVLSNVLDEKIDIDQICVEFHHFFDSITKARTKSMIKRLLESGYILFHKRELDYSFYKSYLLKSV